MRFQIPRQLAGMGVINHAASHRKVQVDDLCTFILCYYCQLFRQAGIKLIATVFIKPGNV